MTTECTQVGFEFHSLNHRQIRAQFDGGAISSEGGGLVAAGGDKRTGIIRKFAACFTDYRDPERIEHRLEELVAQRVYGLALGYEDLNDHDQLRNDPLLAVLVEKSDPSQEVLAGKSTLNRLELTPGHSHGPGALQEGRVGPRGSGWPVGRFVSAGARGTRGRTGPGFAVVADEVRKLAERTTTATKEIAQMIRTIQDGTKAEVTAMEQGTRQVEDGVRSTAN